MDYQSVLDEIAGEVAELAGVGDVAAYIPELARVPAAQFGMALITLDGQVYTTGDATTRFSIQSISKVFTLILAIQAQGEALFARVGKEPSGNPFNSLVQLEYENGIPRNPFINAGALVVTDVLFSSLRDPRQDVLAFVRQLSGAEDIDFDRAVAASERKVGFTNAALANFLKGHGNLQHPVATVLDAYFDHCAISMSCLELARAFLFLANHGVLPEAETRLLSSSQTNR